MAVLGAFAREVVLDLKDLHGDRAFSRHTIPSLVGHRASCILAIELTIACCGFGLASLFHCSDGPLGMVWIIIFLPLVFWLLIRPTITILHSVEADAFRHYVAATRTGLILIPPLVLLGTIVLN